MGKIPYIPLYIGDWEQDMNAVSLETEAAWLKIIFKMFKNDKKGIYKTSTKGLQNLWKTDTKGVQNILEELRENDICGLEIGENIVFSNRRMIKEAEISVKRTKAVQNRYKTSTNIPTKHLQIPEYEYEYENEYENELKGGAGGKNFSEEKILHAPEKSEVQRVFLSQGGTMQMAEQFFNKYQALGWMINGSPVKQYGYLVANYIQNWKNNGKGKKHQSGTSGELPKELTSGF